MKNRRQFVKTTGKASLATLLMTSLASAKESMEKPNIVLFISDDHSKHDYGCYGEAKIRTPNADRLAADGMRFNQVCTTISMCAPSRSSLYTGLYPVRNGCYMNHGSVKKNTRSLPHDLKPLGYRVILAGKTHIKPTSAFPFEYIPFAKGKQLDFKKIGRALKDPQPVCLIVSSNEPHAPHLTGGYSPDEATVPPYLVASKQTKKKRADYWTDCDAEDKELGKVMKLVDDSGTRDKTLFIYTSDHGYSTRAKWTTYDSGINVATMARWPGRIKPGSTCDALISFVDFLPTFVELAGGTPRSSLDGKSFLPVLKGEETEHHEEVFALHTTQGISNGLPYPVRAIRTKRYKYIRNLKPDNIPTNVANYDSELQERPEGDLASWRPLSKDNPQIQGRIDQLIKRPAEELYDLSEDPWEMTNLIDDPERQDVRQSLSSKLDAWMKQQEDTGLKLEMKVKPRRRDV